MADEGSGGGNALWVVFVCALAYAMGLSFLGGGSWSSLKWWHHVAALAFGLVWLWCVSGKGLVYIGLPGLGVLGMVALFELGHHGWTVAAGVGYLVVGGILGYYANSRRSQGLAWNSVCVLVLGLVTIAVGIIRAYL